MAATLDLKSKEEKDAELDKRIEALRLKNEALMRRYQEIEEDRKKAELEGVAVTAPRKGRLVEKENVAVEVEKTLGPFRRSHGTPRPQGPSKGSRTPPHRGGRAGAGRAAHSWEESPGEQSRGGAGSQSRRGRGRGPPHLSRAGDTPTATADRKSKEWEERRRQNIEKMNEEMEKIAEYERNQREGVLEPNPVRNFLDDPRRRGGPLEEPERDRREGSRRHGRNWGGPDFERVRLEHERQGRRAGLGGTGDMTLSMTGRERLEYLRWKREREQIDQERLQRHRKPTGQWRREWDAEKTEGMFKDGPAPALESSSRSDDQPWARPPKPPTFGEFLSQHKAEVNSRRRRKSSRPQAKVAPRAYSDHDDRWETKEVASPAPELPQPTPPEEPQTQPPKALAPAHQPPEDEGEEDEGEEDEGEEDEEEWEDISGESEEEEEEEEEPTPEHPQEPDPAGHAASEPADPDPPRPQEPPALSQAPASPSSPFLPPGAHQPVSDWGEEMELNSPRTTPSAGALSPGGDQPAPTSPESGPSLPGSQKAEEEEGSEAASGGDQPVPASPESGPSLPGNQKTEEEEGSEEPSEACPEPQEMAEITDFQRASVNV